MFEIAEQKLDVILGVSRDTIRDQRESMTVDVDWVMASNHVMYSIEGIERLLAMLSIEPISEKDARPGDVTLSRILLLGKLGGEEKDARMLVVSDRKVRNSQIVLCELLGEKKRGTHIDGVARVSCKDSRNFIPGMKLLATHIEEDLWLLCGRAPRYRGRW